jgi:methionine-gamma-lyase
MYEFKPEHGIGTLVTHFSEGSNPLNTHIAPIYQTSTFIFPDLASGAALYRGDTQGYTYTRTTNPNIDQFSSKVALLEAIDLLRNQPGARSEEIAHGQAFASGMAAISSAILARVKAGETIITQESIYSNTFNFLHEIAPRYGIQVVWVKDTSRPGWEAAFRAHPEVVLVYAESPANPTMLVVDLAMVAELAHARGAWLMVDNTFATPYCQRPLSLGADVVVHSTTKYLSGHGVIIGGMVVSTHVDYMRQDLLLMLKTLGAASSPFDAWLANLGLKTLELRMQRHCENALAIAHYLQDHPAVAQVHYPGLESHPGHEIAKKQMHAYGGMMSFELAGGMQAGEALMNRTRVSTLTVSLGTVDSLIQHPASLTHSSVPAEERLKMGITDGLVRFSVGIENVGDLIADLDQALRDIS